MAAITMIVTTSYYSCILVGTISNRLIVGIIHVNWLLRVQINFLLFIRSSELGSMIQVD